MAENGEDGTLAEYVARYSDEAACERRLMEERWPGGWECPRCGCRTHTTVGSRRHMRQCTRCRLQFSLTKGTAMEGSKLPLTAWFLAFFLVARSKRGISALELARDLGVCEKTAGYVLLRLRGAMSGSGCL